MNSMRFYGIRYWSNRRLEGMQRKAVWLLPKWVVRWAMVRATLHATNGKWSKEIVPNVTSIEVMKRWDETNDEQ